MSKLTPDRVGATIVFILFLLGWVAFGFILGALSSSSCRAAAPPKTEMRCQQYEEVVVKSECHSDTIEKGAGGAVLGGLAGYFLGGKKWAGAGALAGGGLGAANGKTTCTPVIEKRCKVWVEVPVGQ